MFNFPFTITRIPCLGQKARLIRRHDGFTLLELIVVIVLMGIMMGIALPRFQDQIVTDPNRKVSLWIMTQVRMLKEKAVRDGKRYALNIGLDSGKLWVTDPSMEEDALVEAENGGYELPEGFQLTDVEFPDQGALTSGTAVIRFHEKGYSDKALIHIENDDGDALSFLVEPFLPQVRRFDEYVEFE